MEALSLDGLDDDLMKGGVLNSIPEPFLISNSYKIFFFNNAFIDFWKIPANISESKNQELFFEFLDAKFRNKAFFYESKELLKDRPEGSHFEEQELINGSIISCGTWPFIMDKKVAGRIWNFRDISEQKKIEKTLESQKQELVHAHTIASLGSWKYNIRSKEFLYSDSLSKICEGALQSNSFEEFLNATYTEDLEMVKQFFTRIVAEGTEKSYDLKYRVVSKSGRMYYVRTIVEVVYLLGNPKQLYGTIQDISEQALLEISLASAKEAAEDHILAKDIFFTNISHEMRTPLNAIIGYSDILFQVTSEKHMLEYIRSIKSSSESLLSLIEDIIYISKVDGKKIRIIEEEINLNKVFVEVYELFKFQFEEKGINFTIDVNDSVPEIIYIDKARLKQILVNLTNNALKFTENGYVNIAAFAKQSKGHNKIELNIFVEDTGIGIAEKDYHKIFESFRQIDEKDKRNFEGLGIGLYITKKNIEMLGGTIEVESAPDIGSVFIISFPQLKAATAIDTKNEKTFQYTSQLTFKKAKLLIADDRDFNRKILISLLKKFDFTIIEVDNGKDAVSISEKNKPDIIIMDLAMPVQDGYEATKLIRNKPKIKNTPIIAYVSLENKPSDEKLKNIGFNGFLTKPVSFTHLLEILTMHLKNKITKQQIIVDNEQLVFEKKAEYLFQNIKMIHLIKKSLAPQWETLLEKRTIKNQKQFAENLVSFGKVNKQKFINQLGNELLQSLEIYDVDETKHLMNKIDSLFRRIQYND